MTSAPDLASPPRPRGDPTALSGRTAWQPPAIAGLVAALAVQAWFRPGQFIASGDIPPFERRGLARELFWAWNHQGTPDGGAAASASRWPEVLVARLGDGLGLAGPTSQRFFLTLLAGLLGASIAWMLGPLVQRRIVLVGAALVALATPLTLVVLPNHLALVAMSAVAVLGGSAIRTARGHPPRPIVFVWTTVLVGYLTVNPPLLAVVLGFGSIAIAGALLLVARTNLVAVASRLGVGLGLALVASLIWFVPFLFTILQPGELGSFVASIEVEQWAWTHARSSVGNVVNLTGQWAWDHPEYVPFVNRLDAQPFRWLRWALPLSVLIAPFAQRDAGRRRLCWGILAAAVPLILIGKGLHEPFGGVNRWLYGHVPGLWLLREPLPKVSVVLVPLYVAAWALLLDALAAHLERVRMPQARQELARSGVAAFAVLPLIFGWPIFTGTVFSAGRQADRVAVPPEWTSAAQSLQALDVPGKVLQLPLADYYQVGTTWGYYGADTLLSGRITAPVLQRLPGGYFTSRPAVEDLLAIAESALASGDLARFDEAAERLGVAAAVVRSDFRLDASRSQLVDAEVLRANLARLPGATVVHDGPLLQVARLPRRGLFSRLSTLRPSNDAAILTGPGTASVGATERILPTELSQGLVAVGPPTGATFHVERAGPFRLHVADGTALRYRAAAKPSGVELQPISGLSLDGQPLSFAPLESFGSSGDVGLLGSGPNLVDPSAPDAELVVASGSTVGVYRAVGRDERGSVYRVQDCAKVDERSLDEVGISLQAEGGSEPAFTLTARDHRACSPIDLGPPPGARAVRISYAEQVVSGDSPDPCLLDATLNRCVPAKLQRAPGRVELTAALADIPGPVTLFLYANSGSTVRYGSPTVRWFERSSERKVAASSSPVDLALGEHTVSVGAADSLTVGERSEVSNCAGSESPPRAGISATESPEGLLELSAERGSACVQFPVSRLGSELRVIFDYRAESSGTPRFCLWWEGLNRCAAAGPLTRLPTWATTDQTFKVPEGATGAGLFLYADAGTQGDRRTVSYGRVRFVDVTPLVATLIPADAPPPAPPEALEGTVDRSGNYKVRVTPSATPTLLRFADGWSSRWEAKLRGRPLTHLQVDGFANGWILPASTDTVVVDVAYGPSGTAALALSLGFLALVGVSIGEVAVFGLAAYRRRRPAAPA